MNEREIWSAIDVDDRAKVKRLLRADPSLANLHVSEAKLYRTHIRHWLYVGDTPLHLAAAGSRIEIVNLLLEAGADPNSRANLRQSGPLHYAADTCLMSPSWNAEKQVETIRRLLDGGAQIDAQDKNGATALHRAVRTRGAAAVKYLLETGADTSLKNKPGSTAFHLAVQNTGRGGSGSDEAKAAQREIIEMFLSRGISTRAKDGNGKSVVDCARTDWIRELLQN